MLNHKIAIIGVGTMGWAIAQQLIDKQVVKSENLFLSDRSLKPGTLQKFNLSSVEDNKAAVVKGDVVILAVKPQDLADLLEEISFYILENTLIISIVAGIEMEAIQSYFQDKHPIVRVMPNLGTIVAQSVSCWIKNEEVTVEQVEITKTILTSFGEEVELEKEDEIDKVTAISGSGPAYFFYIAQLLEEGARKLGLNPETARKLVIQTAKGSTALYESSRDADYLRRQVTSKDGTTDAAFKVLDGKKVHETFINAVEASYKRAKELSLKK